MPISVIYMYIYRYIQIDVTTFNSCNTGRSGLPDMYTQYLKAAGQRAAEVHISDRPQVPVL